MWKTTMLKKQCFSNAKKAWNRLRSPDTSKQLCTSVSPKQPANKGKDSFLYLNMRNRVCRLNIRDYCEKQGSSDYELIHDYYPGHPPNKIPTDMKPIIVGSDVYMWGGYSVLSEFEHNFDVYSFDPSASPLFRLCNGPISRLVQRKKDDQRKLYDIEVLSIEEKIYVLDLNRALDLPSIWVFDTVHQSWKDLPHLPCLPNTALRRFSHFFCGHKIFISMDSVKSARRNRVQIGSYIFDTREQKWEATNTIQYDAMKTFKDSAIEFEGFLIAVIEYELDNEDLDYPFEDKVVAYKLDSNGIPNWESYQVLHELDRC